MKRFQICVGKKIVDGNEVDNHIQIEAEHFTIETSGAATFWRTIIKGQSSALVLALAAGQWATIELVPYTVDD